jgi:hypothetical protein
MTEREEFVLGRLDHYFYHSSKVVGVDPSGEPIAVLLGEALEILQDREKGKGPSLRHRACWVLLKAARTGVPPGPGSLDEFFS